MSDLIERNFGLNTPRESELELRQWLVHRIAHMLHYEVDLLMSTLYRLDIDESKIKQVLDKERHIPVAEGLANLVLERQRQRHKTKRSYRVNRKDFYWGEEE